MVAARRRLAEAQRVRRRVGLDAQHVAEGGDRRRLLADGGGRGRRRRTTTAVVTASTTATADATATTDATAAATAAADADAAAGAHLGPHRRKDGLLRGAERHTHIMPLRAISSREGAKHV